MIFILPVRTVCSPFIDINANELVYSNGTLCTNFCNRIVYTEPHLHLQGTAHHWSHAPNMAAVVQEWYSHIQYTHQDATKSHVTLSRFPFSPCWGRMELRTEGTRHEEEMRIEGTRGKDHRSRKEQFTGNSNNIRKQTLTATILITTDIRNYLHGQISLITEYQTVPSTMLSQPKGTPSSRTETLPPPPNSDMRWYRITSYIYVLILIMLLPGYCRN